MEGNEGTGENACANGTEGEWKYENGLHAERAIDKGKGGREGKGSQQEKKNRPGIGYWWVGRDT